MKLLSQTLTVLFLVLGAFSKVQGATGPDECFTIYSTGKKQDSQVPMEYSQRQCMPAAEWNAILQIFQNNQAITQLSEGEKSLLESRRLSLEEIQELRSLRLAMALIEQSLPTLATDVGGIIGNGGLQAFIKIQLPINCSNKTNIYLDIFKKLSDIGALKYFKPAGAKNRYEAVPVWNHTAPMIESSSSGQKMFVDGWYDGGGYLPKIGLFEHWTEHYSNPSNLIHIPENYEERLSFFRRYIPGANIFPIKGQLHRKD